MNNIKFRIWDKVNKKYINYDAFFNFKDFAEFTCFDRTFKTDEEDLVIQQFIGLKDNIGKEIYEGDIISFRIKGFAHASYPENIDKAEVIFDDEYAMFVFREKNGSKEGYTDYTMVDNIDRDSIKVIGNIFNK